MKQKGKTLYIGGICFICRLESTDTLENNNNMELPNRIILMFCVSHIHAPTIFIIVGPISGASFTILVSLVNTPISLPQVKRQ